MNHCPTNTTGLVTPEQSSDDFSTWRNPSSNCNVWKLPAKKLMFLLGILFLFAGARPASADSISVSYTSSLVSGTTYLYTYTLSGTLTANDLLAIYFPYATSASLTDLATGGSSFTTSVLQADSSLPADGEYDILADAATSSFPYAFETTFTYSGSGLPGTQSFTLYDSSFAVVSTGSTTAATTATAVTPEPSSLSLLALGIVVIGLAFWIKERKNRLHLGVLSALLAVMMCSGVSRAQGGGGGGGGGGSGGGGGGGGGGGTTTGTLTGVTIGPYTLQSSYRVSTYEYNYTYTTNITNTNSTAYSLVLGTVTSSNANTVVVAGSVEFGSLPALGTAAGLTTFTVRQDRRYAFTPSNLSWTFAGSTSTSTVGTTPSTLSLAASQTSVSYGTGVSLTATASPTTGTGTITFFDGPTPLGSATLSSGVATLSSVVLPTGTHNLSAVYSGDTSYASSSSGLDPVTVTAGGAATSCSGLAESALVVCLANAFEATLTSAQLSTVQLTYTLAHAEQWSNLPGVTRNGLAFSSLTSTQLAAAQQLAQAAMSSDGYQRFQNIRGADNLLYTYASGGYGAGNYYVAFVGTPSTSSPWLLQFGGHHFAFNHTFNGTYASNTPYFIGVEPTIIPVSGALYMPLEKQRAVAYALTRSVYGNTSALLTGTFDDVVEGVNSTTQIDTNYPQTYPTTGRGLLYNSLTSAQQAQVKAMIEGWVNDSDSTTAAALLAFYEDDAALANTYVGYSGTGTLTSQGDYIRVDGPRVWIEFVVQSGVVFSSSYHFHSLWRDKTADYGGDFLQ